MFVKVIALTLFIPGALTLKDKRQVVQSILEKIHRKFYAATAEVGYQDQWQRAQLGIALVSNSVSHLDLVQAEILKLVENNYPVEITEMTVNDY
jgi:uncharacterized protein YlxP (DUF503 family)